MDRVFLDANVLFSAAYATANRFLDLWNRKGIELLTSDYAVEEARRNLRDVDHHARLNKLVEKMEIVPGGAAPSARLRVDVDLPDKDRPILLAAIGARATHLLTGDRRHFGHLLGKRIGGVRIETPAQFLSRLKGT